MEKKTFISIIALVVLLSTSLFWNYKQYRDLQVKPDVVHDVTVVEYKDIRDSLPAAMTESVVGKIKIPVKKQKANKISVSTNSEKLSENGLDSVLFSENLSDSLDFIEVERVQKVYRDSNYTAFVSGYDPQLDSIFIRQKEITRTITEIRTNEKTEFRRWNVGIAVGYGYGIQTRQLDFFVGVGVTYNIFK